MELTWQTFLFWFVINFIFVLIIFIPIRIFLRRKTSLSERNLKILVDISTGFTEGLIFILVLGFPPIGYTIGIAVLMGVESLFADWLGGKVELNSIQRIKNNTFASFFNEF